MERALLLWPRLQRAKLRKYADDPERIAELVGRRTSQPYEAVLAMITRQSPAFTPNSDEDTGAFVVRAKPTRVALRIVHGTDIGEIRIHRIPPLR